MKKDISTKIIATLGPASLSKSMVKKLIEAGVDIFRLNLSHGDFTSHRLLIKNIRAVSKELGIRAGIMIDLPGPKIRVGELTDDPLVLRRGDTVYLKSASIAKAANVIPVDFSDIGKIVKKGANIYINDGAVKLTVKKITNSTVECRIDVGGEIGSRKGINIPGGSFATSVVTRYDRECVRFGIESKADFFAMSFVREAADLKALRRLVKKEKGSQFLISKIEKPEAVDDFDNILAETDGVMLARGDLGIEIPIEKIPIVQKQLLAKCNSAGKPVITATQVLDSMVRNPRPTRAEAADAANAVLDRTDALMLSQETAIGKYPVDAVRTLRNIIYEAEKILETQRPEKNSRNPSIADNVARSVVETAKALDIKTIVTPTRSGHTARLIARYRPAARILAISESKKTVNDLALSWGIDPVLMEHRLDLAVLINKVRDFLRKERYVKPGEKFIITSGSPVSQTGKTNMMVVETV